MNAKNEKNDLIPVTKIVELIKDPSPNELEDICNKDHEHTIPAENIQTIVVDWLTVSMVKQMPDMNLIKKMTISNGHYNMNPDCYLEYVKSPRNDFDNMLLVSIHGKLVGKLLCNPNNGLPRNTVHLIIENSRFYTNDFVECIDYLVFNLGFKYKHLVRLDIALDFIQKYIMSFLLRFIKSPYICKRGHAVYKPLMKYKNLLSLKIGSITSAKLISCYSKTKDLKRIPRPHLIELWDNNNLNHIDNEVERIELRLFTKYLKNIHYSDLKNVEYLLGICRMHFKDYFQFDSIYTQNYKKVKKDATPIDITFAGLHCTYLTKINSVPKKSNKALITQCHNKVDDILYEQLAMNNEKDLSKIDTENMEIAQQSLERFLQVNPEMRSYLTSKKNSWERQFRMKNLIYSSNVVNTLNDAVIGGNMINDAENEIQDGTDSPEMIPNVKFENIQEYNGTKVTFITPIDQIYLKYRSLPNIQYIIELYDDFVNNDEANNSKLPVNDYIQLLLFTVCDYSKEIRSELLNDRFNNYSLKHFNEYFNCIFQKLISKEYDINHYCIDLVA